MGDLTNVSVHAGSPRLRLITLISSALLIAGCGSSGTEFVARAGDLGHIHDLVLEDDGTLLAASHTGLFRIEGVDRAVLVGEERHDLMAMTSDASGLIASGHPDLRLEEYRVEDRPPFLGLARSENGGESWDVVGLLGEADFHALTATDAGLFAADTSGVIWHLDDAGQWNELGAVEARDLAVDPDDPTRQVAPDYDEGIWASDDGAVTWTRVAGAPPVIEVDWLSDGSLLGVTETGELWRADEPEGPWSQVAAGPADVETLYADPTGSWWITVRGGAIHQSSDGGETWDRIYEPPVDG